MNPVGLPKRGLWVYLLINQTNGKVYVGKTSSPYKRCHQYRYDFRERKIGHLNDYLFRAMQKYGLEKFDFRPWELCANDDHLTERELWWMDRLNSTDRSQGYNLRRDSRAGMITHPETSAKITANLTRQWASGLRSDHGNKLKARWASDEQRRKDQGAAFKRYLTKFTYVVSRPDEDMQLFCDYARLRAYGLGSALSSFMRQQSDVIELKGHTIRRVAACPN